jgi:hypothetical protein
MTVRIPKWVLSVLAVLVVAGLAFGGYLIGRSSRNGGEQPDTSPAHTMAASPSTERQLPCTNGAAKRAILNSDFPRFITSAGGFSPHPFLHRGTGYFIIFLRCADLTGDGQNDMVVGLGAGAEGLVFNWAIFTPTPHGWSLAFHQEGQRVSNLKIKGGKVLEVSPIFGVGDPNCCPSGQRVSTIEWDGKVFRIANTVAHVPQFRDCGPQPPPPGQVVGSPDIEVRGVGCGIALAEARQNFHHYYVCGTDPPPHPPANLKHNPPPWTDYCKGSKRIIEAAE